MTDIRGDDATTAPFWEAASQGRLVVQSCAQCGASQLYPRSVCVACGSSSLDWATARGTGTVYSTTTIRIPVTEERMPPYQVALFDLDEGIRMVVSVDNEFSPGQRARIRWEGVDGSRPRAVLEPIRDEIAMAAAVPPRIEFRHRRSLSKDEERRLHDLLREGFGADFDTADYETRHSSYLVFAYIGPFLTAHVAVVLRHVTFGGERRLIAGVGGVVTAESWRSRGLATRLVTESVGFASNQFHAERVLLRCESGLVPFYGSLGFEIVTGPVQHEGVAHPDDQWMCRSIDGLMEIDCLIDLNGPPW